MLFEILGIVNYIIGNMGYCNSENCFGNLGESLGSQCYIEMFSELDFGSNFEYELVEI